MNNVTIMSIDKLINDMNLYANNIISFGDGCVCGKHHSNPFYKYVCFQIPFLKKMNQEMKSK
jgi:hypothetical protein